MTTVVGIAENGRVWIAADSCLTVDDAEYESASPKVECRGGWCWGMAGSWAAAVVVRDGLDPPSPEDGDVGLFVWRASELLRSNGLSDETLHFLIGIGGRLYHATEQHDWHCIPTWQSGRRKNRTARSWHAIGTGATIRARLPRHTGRR